MRWWRTGAISSTTASTPRRSICCRLLDGTRTLGEIVVAQLERSGELDTAAMVDLVRTLHAGGFLTDPYVDVDAAVARALAPTGPRLGWRSSPAR